VKERAVEPRTEAAKIAMRMGQEIRLGISEQLTAVSRAKERSVRAPLTTWVTGHKAIRAGERFMGAGARKARWLAMPRIAKPAFTISGISFRPRPQKRSILSDMVDPPTSSGRCAAKMIQRAGALGREQLEQHFH